MDTFNKMADQAKDTIEVWYNNSSIIDETRCVHVATPHSRAVLPATSLYDAASFFQVAHVCFCVSGGGAEQKS